MAYDWVAFHINLKEAEALLVSEIAWNDSNPWRAKRPELTLGDRIDEANFKLRVFDPLCTLAWDQIQLKEYDSARATIRRIRAWLDGDFKHYFDQDPLEAFPDIESKYLVYSAQLAQAEGRNADALAFYQRVIGNPYYRREYSGGYVNEARSLWKQIGGSDDGWAFAAVPELPAGVPKGQRDIPFLPWIALDFKLPEMKLPALDAQAWTIKNFEGKATMVYLWASWCGPCWRNLPAIQTLYNTIKERRDIQIVTLSVDEDQGKLAAFMKEKGYTFPVIVGKDYAKNLLPQMIMGQHWIVDRSGSVRLVRVSWPFTSATQAFVDESIYKLTQMSTAATSPVP